MTAVGDSGCEIPSDADRCGHWSGYGGSSEIGTSESSKGGICGVCGPDCVGGISTIMVESAGGETSTSVSEYSGCTSCGYTVGGWV